MMNTKLSKDDLLKSLQQTANKLTGIPRASVEFKIRAMSAESILGDSNLASKARIDNKIQREKNLLGGYNKIILANPDLESSLREECNFAKLKIYFLNKQLSDSVEDDTEKVSTDKTSGKVTFSIESIEVDPAYKLKTLDVYLDSKLVESIKTPTNMVLDFEANREMEMIVRDAENKIIGILFFPCYTLINLNPETLFSMNFQNNVILTTKIVFERKKRLLRKNAEIVVDIKNGHELGTYTALTPFYCCVCESMTSLFSDCYRCKKCNFTCHKKCSNFILFNCKMSNTKINKTAKISYNIPHILTREKSSGLRYCGHCGCRMLTVKDSLKCDTCGGRYHINCEPGLFCSCNITLEFRKQVSNIKIVTEGQVNSTGKAKHTINEYSLIKVLGRGSFGKVMLARHKYSREIIALKILKKESVVNADNLVYLELERHVLEVISASNSPFLMNMTCCFQDKENIYFGTEYLSGGDLFHHVSNNKFTDKQIKLWSSEIVLGLGFLHSKNIIYRDLKLDNILLTNDGHVKIADFGLCKTDIDFDTVTYTFCGTPDTIAPEVILQNGYTKDADWWSLGVVVYEMYEIDPPFNGATTKELTDAIVRDEPEYSSMMPSDAKEFVIQLLQKDPTKRLGFGKDDYRNVLSDKYFDDVDLMAVQGQKLASEFCPGESFDNFDEEFTDEPIIITPSGSVAEYDRFFSNFN